MGIEILKFIDSVVLVLASNSTKRKSIVKKIVVTLIIITVIFASYFYLLHSHIAFEEVRVSNEAEEVKAVYVNVTGDPLCAKLYKLDQMDNNRPVVSKTPLFIALPNGAPSPVEGALGYADNVYMLKGYNYLYEERNRLTGATKTSPSHRFDVIA